MSKAREEPIKLLMDRDDLTRGEAIDLIKVEHATITHQGLVHPDGTLVISGDGSYGIPWKIKQEIKDEVFGKDGVAVEVFPEEGKLIDTCDVYHLWILPKHFKMPFGIHPKDTKTQTVNRGVPRSIGGLIDGANW